MDSPIDITQDDLLTLYARVMRRLEERHLDPSRLELGRAYSNGKYGELWSVRQIVDWGGRRESGELQIVYQLVAGAGRRSTAVVSAQEFARWAKYEVYPEGDHWRPVANAVASEPGPGQSAQHSRCARSCRLRSPPGFTRSPRRELPCRI